MTQRIVSNTGPLIALDGVGSIDILSKIFAEVMIPRLVYKELTDDFSEPGGISFKCPDWIRVIDESQHPDPLLARMLDIGEAAVIDLALKSTATVLMDERKGRKIAGDIYGLPVIGTAGVLIRAKKAGLIDSATKLLKAMRQQGYWVDDTIIRFAMDETNES